MKGTVTISTLGSNGRLANQMFQLACVYTYARNCGKMIGHPEWKYAKYFKGEWPATNNIVIDKIYNEPAFTYNEIPCFYGIDVDLQGYWQSPRYFEGTDVNSFFELKDEYQKQVDDLYDRINPKRLKTVSIHIRRGDYLNPPHDEYHGVLSEDYYDDAIKALYGRWEYNGDEWKDYLFVICTDDPEWFKENMKNENINSYLSEGNGEIIDLFLMAKCQDNIIANSSFSYWSALLNKNPNKRIVAPGLKYKWFKGADLDCKDLYTKEMILV